MQLTKKQKDELLELLKKVDVKELEIEGFGEDKTKWFRFGSYNGMQIASEIIKKIPERKTNAKLKSVVS